MWTLFTAPKAFHGRSGVIQRNAIRSWMHLAGGARILLFRDEAGIAETAGEFGLIRIPEVERTEHGTPRI
jgi:hypothetical protein